MTPLMIQAAVLGVFVLMLAVITAISIKRYRAGQHGFKEGLQRMSPDWGGIMGFLFFASIAFFFYSVYRLLEFVVGLFGAG